MDDTSPDPLLVKRAQAGDRVVVLKGRPSSVFEVIDVDLPAPRDRSTLAHPRFSELREHVWGTLMDEVRAAEFDVR